MRKLAAIEARAIEATVAELAVRNAAIAKVCVQAGRSQDAARFILERKTLAQVNAILSGTAAERAAAAAAVAHANVSASWDQVHAELAAEEHAKIVIP